MAFLCTSLALPWVIRGPFCTQMRSHQEYSFKGLTCLQLGLEEKYFIPRCKCRKQVNISCLQMWEMWAWAFVEIWVYFNISLLVISVSKGKTTWTGIDHLLTSTLLLGSGIQKKTKQNKKQLLLYREKEIWRHSQIANSSVSCMCMCVCVCERGV